MNDATVDQEVRIRLLEKICEKIDIRFEKLDNKIDSHFRWTLGIMLSMNVAVVTLLTSIMFYLNG